MASDRSSPYTGRPSEARCAVIRLGAAPQVGHGAPALGGEPGEHGEQRPVQGPALRRRAERVGVVLGDGVVEEARGRQGVGRAGVPGGGHGRVEGIGHGRDPSARDRGP
ncbi:hypothetical protein JS756_21480 [Streptomyces actuosus]|uniref:Uncharacterized protein n=1 Tax=Streptomyces actuosus TaxID=1885 RepID=A0ABS2VU41_STRAS|nr:hypothetical protein [Streptomyces actuosus]